MTLNDFTNDLMRLASMDYTAPEDGETEEEFAARVECLKDTLAMVLADRDDKIDDYAYVMRKLAADADFLKAEKQRLERRQKSLEANVQRMKDALLYHMQQTGEKSIKTEKNTFSVRTTQKVIVDDLNTVPEEMLRVKVEADLAKLKAAIKLGIQCGAHLEESQSVTVR